MYNGTEACILDAPCLTLRSLERTEVLSLPTRTGAEKGKEGRVKKKEKKRMGTISCNASSIRV